MKNQQQRNISWLSDVNEQNMAFEFCCSKLSSGEKMEEKRSYERKLRH